MLCDIYSLSNIPKFVRKKHAPSWKSFSRMRVTAVVGCGRILGCWCCVYERTSFNQSSWAHSSSGWCTNYLTVSSLFSCYSVQFVLRGGGSVSQNCTKFKLEMVENKQYINYFDYKPPEGCFKLSSFLVDWSKQVHL